MSAMDRVFSDFDSADPSKSGGGNPYINGHSINTVEIQEVKVKDSETSSKIWFIVEYIVRSSNRDDLVKNDLVYAWAHDLTNKYYGAANAKQFLAAAMGLDVKSEEAKALGQEEVEQAIAEDQPLKGMLVTLTTKQKKLNDGGDFTMHEWSPAAEESAG